MIDALAAAADAVETDLDVRAAIIAGEGKAFCAGGDIAAWGGLEPLDMWRHWVRAGHRAFDRLARLRVPLIAVLSGHALGGGLELAATADFRIAEPRRSSVCRRRASAWCRAGRARSGWCAASASRP
jgi:enoyl-CoA hydratase/carnithine racemase